MTPVKFYDSDPGDFDNTPAKVPLGAQYTMLYADTSLEFGYRPQGNPGVPNVRYITRRGNTASEDAARYAGAADYEQGNLVYGGGRLGAWAAARNSLGLRARVYCDRADVATAHPQLKGLSNIEWWIATLDNNPHWTPALIVESVEAVSGVVIPADLIWGIQWGRAGQGGYDTSYLFGEW